MILKNLKIEPSLRTFVYCTVLVYLVLTVAYVATLDGRLVELELEHTQSRT